MNFDQIVNTILEGKKDEWVLFIKRNLWGEDGNTEVTYQLKPAVQLTNKEKNIIKNDMESSYGYKNGYDGSDIMGYDEVTVVFGSKKELDKEIKDLKYTYDNVKEEKPLSPELQPHWGDIVDEL